MVAAIKTPNASFPPNNPVITSAGTYRWNNAAKAIPARKYHPVAFTFLPRFLRKRNSRFESVPPARRFFKAMKIEKRLIAVKNPQQSSCKNTAQKAGSYAHCQGGSSQSRAVNNQLWGQQDGAHHKSCQPVIPPDISVTLLSTSEDSPSCVTPPPLPSVPSLSEGESCTFCPQPESINDSIRRKGNKHFFFIRTTSPFRLVSVNPKPVSCSPYCLDELVL